MIPMRRRLTPLVFFLAGCEAKAPVTDELRPVVMLTAPAQGADVTYGAPFSVTALVVAPAGARLLALELTASGGWSERRTLALSGEQQAVTTELRVDRDEWLGGDGDDAQLVLIAEAEVDGQRRASLPAGVGIRLTDRRGPELTVRPPVDTGSAPGVDWVRPGAQAFQVQLSAQDPTGGVVALGIDAPPELGGPRRFDFAAAPFASTTFTLEPPLNGDFELGVWAEDPARAPNRTTQTFRVRFGAGGADLDPPVLLIQAPTTLECGTAATATVSATDTGLGPERLTVTLGAGAPASVYGPNPATPERLDLHVRLFGRAVGAEELRAEAVDRGGRPAQLERSYAVIDTHPPHLEPPAQPWPTAAPGEPLSLTLEAEERCGALARATLVLDDGARSIRAEAGLFGRRQSGPVEFALPRGICTLDPVQAALRVEDDRGLGTATAAFSLEAVDHQPPQIQLNTLVPASGLEPGERVRADLVLADPEVGVRSATVTLTASGVDRAGPWEAPIIVAAPRTSCAAVAPLTVAVDAAVPVDLFFTGPEATLHLLVEAQDHSGRITRTQSDLLLVDRAPPELTFLPPPEGPVALAGETRPVRIRVRDRHHPLAELELEVTGPASFGGQSQVTVPLSGSTATVAVDLTIDPSPLADQPIVLLARARDTARLPNQGSARTTWFTCGAPNVAAIAPAVGPVLGDQAVALTGQGFRNGVTHFALDGAPLVGLAIASSTLAYARTPLGPHPAGWAELTAFNTCGGPLGASWPDAYRYAAPPTIVGLRPGPQDTATPGESLLALVAAEGDQVALRGLTVIAGAGAPTYAAGNGRPEAAALASTVVPTSAVDPIVVSAEAEDELGQRTTWTLALPVAAPTIRELIPHWPTRPLALGESIGLFVHGRASDGSLRDVTDAITVQVSPPGIFGLSNGPRLLAQAVGSATVTVTSGALQVRTVLEVVDDRLIFEGPPLFLSSLAASGTVGAALELLHLQGGQAHRVTAQASFSVDDPSVARLAGGRLRGEAPGDTTVRAVYLGRDAALPVRVRSRLDVGAGERWQLPDRQVFGGGQVDGRIEARPGPGAGDGFTLAITGPTFTLGPTGSVLAHGHLGLTPGAGGDAGPAGGGGGAAAYPSGAPGGRGDPNGASTLDHGATTPGGDGGGRQGSGGRGARAQATSAGAGGGGDGDGGRGGDGVPASMVLGGAGRHGLDDRGGGGGGGGRGTTFGGSGGGGGGARFVLEAPLTEVRLEGTIDASGGGGGYRALGTPGGGGGGGAVLIAATRVLGQGRIWARGGAGGGAGTGSNRGSGGGGGGGSVRIVAPDRYGARLDLDVDGGRTGPAAGTARAGEPGQPGRILRD